ncbi:MAG: NUDIX domain-containing protein [bacterium]
MTKRKRFAVPCFVAALIRKENKILLVRRYKTGDEDGLYGCAGGGLDDNEPVTHAVVREAQEELGITLKKENLKIVHVLHRRNDVGVDVEEIGFFVLATEWEGELQNMEPHKHDDVRWFELDALPENIMPTLIQALEMIRDGIFYSEMGWDLDFVSDNDAIRASSKRVAQNN